MADKRPRGRPSLYSREVAEEICDRLARGESLLKICSSDHLPTDTCVRQWALDDREGFYSQYTRARDIGLDVRADRLEEKLTGEPDTQRARLLFDHDRWYLSKMAPKRYGDKVINEHGGSDGGAIAHEFRWAKSDSESVCDPSKS
jgi:hypothetical protein